MKNPKGRIFELDFLRGLALILMVLDHLAFDLYALPYWFSNVDHPLMEKIGRFGLLVSFADWRTMLHYIFATLFLLLAGIGSALTRHPLKRCGQLTAAALGLTAVTVLGDLFFDLGITILFGVLSVMAVGAFLCWIASRMGKFGTYAALFAGGLIIVAGFCIPWYAAPEYHILRWEYLWKFALGTAHYGADWFPILPCAGVILVGYFLGKTLYADRRSKIPFLRDKSCILCWVGQHSLGIYLLHQPILAGLLFLFVTIFMRG